MRIKQTPVTMASLFFWSVLILSLASMTSLAQQSPPQLGLWAMDDMVRINPENGKAFEDNPKQLPHGLSGDYQRTNSVWSASNSTVRLSGARNEVLAFQLIIEGRGEGFRVETSELKHPSGAVIPLKNIKSFREWYIWVPETKPMKGCSVPLASGWYAEVAIPLSESKYGNNFAIPSKDFHDPDAKHFPDQKNQAIWVDIHIPKTATPGTYAGKVSVTNKDGQSASINVAVQVWNVSIPSRTHMTAHLANYGGTARETPEMMRAYYSLAYEHRCVINDDLITPAKYDGTNYDWKVFEDRYAPFFDGSAFTEGPTAGEPLPFFGYPINFRTFRPDKNNKQCSADWPVAASKTTNNFGVIFTDNVRANLTKALRTWERHFVEKGWTNTLFYVYQDCVDEPGFHMKDGPKFEAGKAQAKTILESAKVIKESGTKLFHYRFDAGGGFSGNRLDLDNNGKVEGPLDVAKFFGHVSPVWYIHGLCMDMPSVDYLRKECGVPTICFYNGFEPRVAPNTIHAALVGFRQWALIAWRDGLDGWADWQFRLESDLPRIKGTPDRKVWYETQNSLQRNMYLYRGEQIGLDDKIFASLRMKSMRRGAQDFELLRLLSLKDGNDRRAQDIASRVCQKVFSTKVETKNFEDDAASATQAAHAQAGKLQGLWSNDPATWAAFHQELGMALSQ